MNTQSPEPSAQQQSEEQIARKAAVECMISAYGFYNGGSAGATEAMAYARQNQLLPGLHHVSEERFLPLILSAIRESKSQKDKKDLGLETPTTGKQTAQETDKARLDWIEYHRLTIRTARIVGQLRYEVVSFHRNAYDLWEEIIVGVGTTLRGAIDDAIGKPVPATREAFASSLKPNESVSPAIASDKEPLGTGRRRSHVLQSAGYWFDASRKEQDKGNMSEALMCMENGYNHLENALAVQSWIATKERPPTEKDGDRVGEILAFEEDCNWVAEMSWRSVAEKPHRYPYWMPIPPLPQQRKERE